MARSGQGAGGPLPTNIAAGSSRPAAQPGDSGFDAQVALGLVGLGVVGHVLRSRRFYETVAVAAIVLGALKGIGHTTGSAPWRACRPGISGRSSAWSARLSGRSSAWSARLSTRAARPRASRGWYVRDRREARPRQVPRTDHPGLGCGRVIFEPPLLSRGTDGGLAGYLGVGEDDDQVAVQDPSIGDVMKSWKELDLALVGIGSLAPSPLLRQSGNALTQAEQDQLRNAGAVGDVCLRFFDTSGATVKTPLDERVMSITPADLMQVPRRVGVAGGASKYRAIRAALRGAWVNVLVTDLDTGRALVEDTEVRLADLLPAQVLG